MACTSLNSTWIEEHGYLQVKSENSMFMKWEGDDFFLHATFVNDFATIPSSEKLKEEFVLLYSADFDVTGGALME